MLKRLMYDTLILALMWGVLTTIATLIEVI